MADTVVLDVTRYRPEQDAAPVRQQYEVPRRPEWVLLDALNHVKDTVDGSLTYRWSCRMGVCGSCGMTVNGRPTLACASYLTEQPSGPIRVEPLRHFPVVRDLVVDISTFLAKLQRVSPWIVRRDPTEVDNVSSGEFMQTPAQLERYRQFSQCINCLLCYAACPITGLDQKFVGPAAIALAQRYNLDTRDQGARTRGEVLAEADGLWGCTFVGECTAVCPKHVDPAGAIQQYKLQSAIDKVTSFLLPRGGQ